MPETRVDLRNPYCPWAEAERGAAHAWAKGFAWQDGRRLNAKGLAERLCEAAPRGSAADAKALRELARTLNGNFALAVQALEVAGARPRDHELEGEARALRDALREE